MKKRAIVVNHNTGLGDLIVMNGCVNYLSTIYDKVFFVTWDTRVAHAEFIYQHNEKLEVYVKPRPASTRQAWLRIQAAHREIRENNPDLEIEKLTKGYIPLQKDWKRIQTTEKIWPEIFYTVQGVPYEYRYSYMNIPRDFERENRLTSKILAGVEDFAFCVCDTRQYQYSLDFKTSLKIVNPLSFSDWKETLLFDWQGVIEKAKEIHTVDTSWMHMIRTMRLKIPKFYYCVRDVAMSQEGYLNDSFESGWKRVRNPRKFAKENKLWWLK